MKKIVQLVALVACVNSVSAAEHTKDTLQTVKQGLKSGKAILIDVREEAEWKAGHLKTARLVPLSQLRDKAARDKLAKTLPKKKIIYCHCRSGGRVLIAADILVRDGFDIRPLKTGYAGLVKAGFPPAKK
jgi:rhodanese-related sulfurtransferase